MKLFLASEAKHPDTIAKLSEILGEFKSKTLAYIPTANNGENPFEDWKSNSETWKLVQTLGAKVTSVQLEDYKDSSVINALKEKDVLWFAGGAAGYLMYWIRRCKLDKALPELLQRSMYVGSSAGSMITAKTLDICEWYYGEPEPGSSAIPGLGLVDFDFYPHFEDEQIEHIKEHYRGNKLYLLKNGEELIVENGKVKVIGEERIIKNNP